MEGPDQPIKLESDLGRGVARMVSLLTLVAVLGLLGVLGWLFVVYPDSDGPEGYQDEVVLEVAEGTTLRRLATELEEKGILKDARVWSVYMRMRGLDRHLRQGKIRFIGVTEYFYKDPSHQMLELALAEDIWDTIMVKYGILNMSADRTVLPLARERNVGVINMSAYVVKSTDDGRTWSKPVV